MVGQCAQQAALWRCAQSGLASKSHLGIKPASQSHLGIKPASQSHLGTQLCCAQEARIRALEAGDAARFAARYDAELERLAAAADGRLSEARAQLAAARERIAALERAAGFGGVHPAPCLGRRQAGVQTDEVTWKCRRRRVCHTRVMSRANRT
jgi:hypothetical protein